MAIVLSAMSRGESTFHVDFQHLPILGDGDDYELTLHQVTNTQAPATVVPHTAVTYQAPLTLHGRLTATLTVTPTEGDVSTATLDVPPSLCPLSVVEGVTNSDGMPVWAPSDGGGHGLALQTDTRCTWTTPRVLVGTPLASASVAASAHGTSTTQLVHADTAFSIITTPLYLFTCPAPVVDILFSVCVHLASLVPAGQVHVTQQLDTGAVRLHRNDARTIRSVTLAFSGSGATDLGIAGTHVLAVEPMELRPQKGTTFLRLPAGSPTVTQALEVLQGASGLTVPTAITSAIRVEDGNGLAYTVPWAAGVFAPAAMVSYFASASATAAAASRTAMRDDETTAWHGVVVTWDAATATFTFSSASDSGLPFSLTFLDARIQYAFGCTSATFTGVTAITSDLPLASLGSASALRWGTVGTDDAVTQRAIVAPQVHPTLVLTVDTEAPSATQRIADGVATTFYHDWHVGDPLVATSAATGEALATYVVAAPSRTTLQIAVPTSQTAVLHGHQVSLSPLCAAERALWRWVPRPPAPFVVPAPFLGLPLSSTSAAATAIFRGGVLPRIPAATPTTLVAVQVQGDGITVEQRHFADLHTTHGHRQLPTLGVLAVKAADTYKPLFTPPLRLLRAGMPLGASRLSLSLVNAATGQATSLGGSNVLVTLRLEARSHQRLLGRA